MLLSIGGEPSAAKSLQEAALISLLTASRERVEGELCIVGLVIEGAAVILGLIL
jgi:hypothetical protein